MIPRRLSAHGFILMAVGLQVVAAFKLLAPPERFAALRPLRVAPAPALWPFLDYDMYTAARGPGGQVHRWTLQGVSAGGSVRPLTEEDFGLSYRWFRDEILVPLRDGHEGAVERAAARLLEQGGEVPRAVRVEGQRQVITPDGIALDPPFIAREIVLRREP